jgi:hypothetical protein
MKRLVAVALIAMLLLPGVAYAGSATNAALGLGAFAALGTILLGAAALSHPAVAASAPVVYAPPPAAVYAPAPPQVIYVPAPVYGYGYYVPYGYGYGYGHARHWHR